MERMRVGNVGIFWFSPFEEVVRGAREQDAKFFDNVKAKRSEAHIDDVVGRML